MLRAVLALRHFLSALSLSVPLAAAADAVAPAAAGTATDAVAPDESRLNLLRALAAAKDLPFVEPVGDLKAMLLRQNPELAAADCGVRYKQLEVAGAGESLTLLVAPQGRCRNTPGMPPQWVLTVKVAQPR
jgi:hypothetical protein